MLKTKFRYVMSGSMIVRRKDLLGAVAYVKDETHNGKVRHFAMGFRSEKQVNHDFYHSFSSPEKREKFVTDWFASLLRKEEVKKQRKAETKARNSQPNPFKVGDILHYSWGWEQTNCEFYQVTAIKARQVVIREIASRSVGPDGFMSTRLVPVKDAFLANEEPMTKIVKFSGDGALLSMDHGIADLWDGNPEYSSWYA